MKKHLAKLILKLNQTWPIFPKKIIRICIFLYKNYTHTHTHTHHTTPHHTQIFKNSTTNLNHKMRTKTQLFSMIRTKSIRLIFVYNPCQHPNITFIFLQNKQKENYLHATITNIT